MSQRGPAMLFQPGAGMPPPHLAGRESEQDYFTALLQQLRTGSGAPADVILTGPRGNGKTVLLRWLAREAAKATVPGGALRETDVLWLTPTDIRTEANLRERLLPPTLLQQLGERLRAVGVLGVKAELGEAADRAHYLGEALIARCRRKPLVVLLDEAHTLDVDVGRTLLNASQVVRPDAPFLLALAGTPDLPMRLNEMDVSFWTRARQMGVGRINPAAAADALAVPLNGAVRTALLHLGYLWRSPASRHWEPGIPSLMSYVQAHEE